MFILPDASHLIDYFITNTHLSFPLQIWPLLLCLTDAIVLSRGLHEIWIIVLSFSQLSKQFKEVIHIKHHTNTSHCFSLHGIYSFVLYRKELILLKGESTTQVYIFQQLWSVFPPDSWIPTETIVWLECTEMIPHLCLPVTKAHLFQSEHNKSCVRINWSCFIFY